MKKHTYPSDDLCKTAIRIPYTMRDELVAISEREGRSLNSLIVELLQEKLDSLSQVQSLADRDPLEAAWYAAESAELFSRSIRGAISRYRKMEESVELDIPDFLLESAAPAPELGEPISQLTPFQRELVEELSNLPTDKLEAMRTLIKR